MDTRRFLPLVWMAGAACVSDDVGGLIESEPPAISDRKADEEGGDRADRACRVILRSVARAKSPNGLIVVDDGSYVWRGTVDVEAALVDAGATVGVLYQPSNLGTFETAAVRTDEAAGPGRVRFGFAISGRGRTAPEPGWSGSAHAAARAQLIPFVRDASGRRFDHNRVASDFSNYVLNAANDFAIADDLAACPALAPRATVRFDGAFTTVQTGAIVAGGDLTIDYALDRLPACRFSRAGYQLWDIEATLKFEPSGEVRTASVTMVAGSTRVAFPWTVRVPLGTQRLQAWFRNYSAAGQCEAWDSRYGSNYQLRVVAAPAPVAWAGNWGNGNWRGCEHRPGVDEPITIDSYLRERACLFVDADVYVPGLTDGAEQHPEHLWAQAEWTPAGGVASQLPLQFVARVGNDYRYRFQLPYEVRQPGFMAAAYRFRFSTDGHHWYRIGQGDGPDGGAARTVVVAP